MEALLEGEELRADGLAFRAEQASVSASELERALPGLGAGVGEEDAIEAGALGETQGQLGLTLVVEEVRGVDELAALNGDGVLNDGAGIAESVDADAAEQVEVADAVLIDDVDTFAMGEQNGEPFVCCQQQFGFRCANLIEFGQFSFSCGCK